MDNNEFEQQPKTEPTLQPQQNYGPQLESPMSLGDWIITLIVLGIPCVNIIMLFVWGFGQGNTSRKNYCRATLIFLAIGTVLGLLFSATFAAMFANFSNSMY